MRLHCHGLFLPLYSSPVKHIHFQCRHCSTQWSREHSLTLDCTLNPCVISASWLGSISDSRAPPIACLSTPLLIHNSTVHMTTASAPPETLFALTISDHSRVKLVLDTKFLFLDYLQPRTSSNIACFSPVACLSPGSAVDDESSQQCSIPYFNILYADVTPPNTTTSLINYGTLSLDYCIVTGADAPITANERKAKLARLAFHIDAQSAPAAAAFAAALMARAYNAAVGCIAQKRLLVFVNPFGGKGKAIRRFRAGALPVLEVARCKLNIVETKYRNYALEYVENTQGLEELYDGIVCCSGDGIPHEVFNGLAHRSTGPDRAFKIPVCQIPCGTGNALAKNLCGTMDPAYAALCTVKGAPTPIDLCIFTQNGKSSVSFLSQAIGLIADVDLGTEHMRWMGNARVTVGLLQRVFAHKSYALDAQVRIVHDSRDQIRRAHKKHTARPVTITPDSPDLDSSSAEAWPDLKYGDGTDDIPEDWVTLDTSNISLFYVGKMPWMAFDALFFPAALPRDGYMDLVTVDATIPTFEILSIMSGVAEGKHFESDHVKYYKCDAYRVTPTGQEGYVSIDGEKFDYAPFQVEVKKRLGTVLSYQPIYQAPAI
ncbi:ATP-NAD kinase-like domain-containing protein [Limtongia smithiae]|uniref:ATP-NAD kinase-like domain-containing protein n=1 Tax=Limtongia smithiae TaxID=1125753 RepID=UPI0034CD823C